MQLPHIASAFNSVKSVQTNNKENAINKANTQNQIGNVPKINKDGFGGIGSHNYINIGGSNMEASTFEKMLKQ